MIKIAKIASSLGMHELGVYARDIVLSWNCPPLDNAGRNLVLGDSESQLEVLSDPTHS